MFSYTATLVYRISSPLFSPTACDPAACIVIVSYIINWVAFFRMAMVLKSIPGTRVGAKPNKLTALDKLFVHDTLWFVCSIYFSTSTPNFIFKPHLRHQQ